MISLSLLILSPPQDIESGICQLQSDILSRYGFASAMAFPVMLPLCPVPKGIGDFDIKKALVSNSFNGFTIATSHIAVAGGSIFLTVKETNMLVSLINQCRESMRLLSETLQGNQQGNLQSSTEIRNTENQVFPYYRGFFLAQNQSGVPENEIMGKIAPPLLDFNYFSLSLLKINISTDISSWWENLDWEVPFTLNCIKAVVK